MSYEDLIAGSPQGTIFTERWWLDAVAPGSYEILTVGKDGVLEAAWPVVDLTSRTRGRVLGMPPLTPWLGILHAPSTATMPNRLARSKRVIDLLTEKLPAFDELHALFHPSFDYWLPLHWRGFAQTTWYSYALLDTSDEEALLAGMHPNCRGPIKKAAKEGIRVEVSDDLHALWEVLRLSFEWQGLALPHERALMDRVDDACRARDRRRIFLARGADGRVNAGVYLVWDDRSAYYLLGGADPARRDSGAGALALWEAIRFSRSVSRTFDFEGSAVKSVERYFRSFGATPQPYYEISRVDSRLRRVAKAVRAIRG